MYARAGLQSLLVFCHLLLSRASGSSSPSRRSSPSGERRRKSVDERRAERSETVRRLVMGQGGRNQHDLNPRCQVRVSVARHHCGVAAVRAHGRARCAADFAGTRHSREASPPAHSRTACFLVPYSTHCPHRARACGMAPRAYYLYWAGRDAFA